MSKIFKLTAEPGLLREGEFQGHLETVSFTAESETELHKWWAVNTGALEQEFGQLVSAEFANHVMNRLRRGQAVEFPNRYDLNEVKRKFGGSWSG